MTVVIVKGPPTGHLYQSSEANPADAMHYENSITVGASNCARTKTSSGRCLSFCEHFKKLKLEFVAFLFMFSYVMTRISSTSMILDKVCLVHFGYPEDVCSNLGNHTKIKPSVERLATNYQLGHTLIQTAPAALLACFVGPWSDRYGRRLPAIIAIIGMVIDGLGSTICAYFLKSRVEYYYIPALFTGIFGGTVSILAVVYSYASDSTELKKRTMKFALIEIASGFASPLGATAGGWIYKFLGYSAVFLFSTGGLFLSLIWVIFILKETRGLDNDDPWLLKFRNLFSCASFKESFIATSKQRPHKGRKQIILLIISMCFLLVTTNSPGDINYLYVHHQFNWGNTTYSTITAIYSIFGIFLLIIVVPLLKYLKTSDPALGLIGTLSLLVKNIGMGLAFKPATYHFANLFGLLSACAPLAVRSRISKVVSAEDLGKVFSFVATAESLLPILTTVLISQIFNASLTFFPGMPYITLALFLILPLTVFIWMMCLPPLSYEDIDHISRTTANSEDKSV